MLPKQLVLIKIMTILARVANEYYTEFILRVPTVLKMLDLAGTGLTQGLVATLKMLGKGSTWRFEQR